MKQNDVIILLKRFLEKHPQKSKKLFAFFCKFGNNPYLCRDKNEYSPFKMMERVLIMLEL